jgi:hypothetical protein
MSHPQIGLIGERTRLALNYEKPIDPDNLGAIFGPDVWGARYRLVGIEGTRGYFLAGAKQGSR